MPTTPVRDWGEALMTSLAAALAMLLGAVPKVLGFLVILIIGWLVASALAGAIAALLRAVRFNELADRAGFGGFVRNMGVRADPASVLATVAKWFVRLIVLVVAFDALGLPAVSQVLQQLLLWLPNLVVALVVLVLGGLAASALAGLVRGATAEAGLGFGLGGRDTAAEIVRNWYTKGRQATPKMARAADAAGRQAREQAQAATGDGPGVTAGRPG